MTRPSQGEVTRLLVDWSNGNQAAVDQLMPLVYDELHKLAESHMRRERREHTLQPTALVHEAYCRLIDQDRAHWHNRAQFFGIAAQQMRRILVDHARRRRYAKRQGSEHQISLEDAVISSPSRPTDLVALDDALEALAQLDPRMARVVELRIFGGLTIEESAAVLGVSNTTVITDFKAARAWLYRELSPDRAGEAKPPATRPAATRPAATRPAAARRRTA
ncbi:MAG: sigma-70 family RNA polymerase sigma factor [Acidobacteriota bacterium]